jgi:hypothetical protein
MIFCKIDKQLVKIIEKEANGRLIVDCGAGEGQLQDLTHNIISLDIRPVNKKVLQRDCTIFPFKENMMPIFIRPCHSGFVEDTLMNCYRTIKSALYISNPKNLQTDLGIFLKLAFIISEWVGEDAEERIYRIPFDPLLRENKEN